MAINWRKDWIVGLMAVVLVLGVTATVDALTDIGEPFGGFYAYRNHAWNNWKIGASTPPWWVQQTTLQYADILVSIEGQPYDRNARWHYVLAQDESRDSVQLEVERNGIIIAIETPLQNIKLSTFLDINLPDIISGVGFLWLAFIVYRTRPEEQVNRLFSVATSLAAASIWLSVPSIFPESDIPAKLNAAGWAVTTAFVGACFVHLTFIFPIRVRRFGSGWVRGLYLCMSFVAAIFAISMVLRWNELAPELMRILSTIGNILATGSLGLGVLVFLVRLIWLLGRRKLSRRERHQVVFLLWGVILAVPYILVVVLRVVTQTTTSYFAQGLDLRYLVLAVPLSFAFVILRYQTFQSPHPSLVGVFLLASSAFFGSLGAWIVRMIEPGWVNAANWTPFVSIFAASLISGLFWSSQSSWFRAFSRFFNWEQRSFEAVQQFAAQTVGELRLIELPQTIATALVKNMELERAAVWVWNANNSAYSLEGSAGNFGSSADKLAALEKIVLEPQDIPPVSIRLSSQKKVSAEWLALFQESEFFEIISPLHSQLEPVGLLALGKRWDDEIFDERDLAIVDLIAQQAALFILTAHQIEQLRQVPHQIAEAQERERFKIAQELHDTVQQFLGSLPFYLQVSRDAISSNPEEANAVLAQCQIEVKTAAQTVRQIRNNLAPLQLERGLVQPLEALGKQFRVRTGVNISLKMDPEIDTVLPLGARHALYRVVQQALDNCASHSAATEVKIVVNLAPDRLNFCIQDNGLGFSPEERLAAADRGSFGLKSMEARITARGGRFTIQSEPGVGTEIVGWLPTNQVTVP